MHIVNGVGWLQGLPRRDPIPYAQATEMANDCAIAESSYTRYDARVTERLAGARRVDHLSRWKSWQHDLPVFNKPDSQEICFVPDQDYARVVRANCG